MASDLSIVIPTYNRQAILLRCLATLGRQEPNSIKFEVIVVDDGSTDRTAQAVQAKCAISPFSLRYIHQENAGAGTARNQGIRAAEGRLLLFLDDDILAAPCLVTKHIEAHDRHPDFGAAILGQVALAPEVPATPLNRRHAVHRWRSIPEGRELPWHHFMTGNVSVKRRFLLENSLWFDEALPRYQDTELAYRCARQGLQVFYCADALGYHLHDLTFDAYLRMCHRYGGTMALLHQRYPELRGELAEYLCFSWRNPPARVIRDLVRPVLLNRLTTRGLAHLVRAAEKQTCELPGDVAYRLGSYAERQGYAEGQRQLRRSREVAHA